MERAKYENAFAAFIETMGLTWDVQIASFNQFVMEDLAELLTDPRCTIRVSPSWGVDQEKELAVEFVGVHVHRPDEGARDPYAMIGGGENASYAVRVEADVRVSLTGRAPVQLNGVRIGEMPIMVGSVLCPVAGLDTGNLAEDESQRGFFIVNGTMKSVVSQEVQAPNRIVRTFLGKRDSDSDVSRVLGAPWSVSVTSRDVSAPSPDAPLAVNTTEPFESSSRFQLTYDPRSGDITVSHNSLADRSPISVSIFLLALGRVWTAAEINALEQAHPFLATTFQKWRESGFVTKTQAVRHVASRMPSLTNMTLNARVDGATAFLERTLFPHLRLGSPQKYVEILLDELLACVESGGEGEEEDDVDHLAFKRIKTTGAMFAEQTRAGFWRFTRDVKRQLQRVVDGPKGLVRAFEGVSSHLRSNALTSALSHWLRTGLHSVPRRVPVAATVHQLNTISPLASIAHMRMSTTHADQPTSAARQLHETQFGFNCPYDTPDGDRVGITKQLALCASRSSRVPFRARAHIVDLVQKNKGSTRLFLDGDPAPFGVDFPSLFAAIQHAKRWGEIPRDVCVSKNWISGDASIRTDEGRLIHALAVLDPSSGATKLPANREEWATLEAMGAVEWIDAQSLWESDPPIVVAPHELAVKPGISTHAYLTGCSFLGLATSTMPFLDRNQGPRNTYGAGMNKQAVAPRPGGAMGRHASLFLEYELNAPQSSLTTTLAERVTGLVEIPNGNNAIVLINTDADNHEDAVVFNEDSIQRGLLRISRNVRVPALIRECDIPVPGEPGEPFDAFGIIEVGTRVVGGDVLVRKKDAVDGRDTSIRLKIVEEGVVDYARIEQVRTRKLAVEMVVFIGVRRAHEADVADKFSTRHGQKFTMGRRKKGVDLPYSMHPRNLGGAPDMVVNPHSIPTRMTIGLPMEMMLAKASCVSGKRADATAFHSKSITEAAAELKEHGFAPDCTERFVNGLTGRMIETGLVVGPLLVQVLGHFRTKGFVRSVGPKDTLTRQPVHGKARKGGLRFGEQERLCTDAHGAAAVGMDRSLKNADAQQAVVCLKCRRLTGEVSARPRGCRWCGSFVPLQELTTKYALILLQRELFAMGVELTLGVQT